MPSPVVLLAKLAVYVTASVDDEKYVGSLGVPGGERVGEQCEAWVVAAGADGVGSPSFRHADEGQVELVRVNVEVNDDGEATGLPVARNPAFPIDAP